MEKKFSAFMRCLYCLDYVAVAFSHFAVAVFFIPYVTYLIINLMIFPLGCRD